MLFGGMARAAIRQSRCLIAAFPVIRTMSLSVYSRVLPHDHQIYPNRGAFSPGYAGLPDRGGRFRMLGGTFPLTNVQIRTYKIKGKPKLRCKGCYFSRRKGILRVLCRENPRHKQRKRHPILKYKLDFRRIALKNMGAREKRKTFVRVR